MKATEQIEFKALNRAIDKIKDIEQRHGWIDYLIAPFFVMIVLLAVYAIKGVYPFGWNTIAYYDMPTQYVPFYSNSWDFFHGKTGLFYTWYFGLGAPTAAGLGNFIYFPTNIILLFISRDHILYTLSILLMLKMILSAFTMSFYCKNRYGIAEWTICAGVLYACSGYVIQYYTNLFFLDYVILFPMIVWAFERLMKEHKYYLFILFLFWAFVPNFQFAAMVVIYLLIKGYFILGSLPDEKKGRSIRLFVLSGFIAAFLAAFAMLPAIFLILDSSRMDLNSGFDYFSTLKRIYSPFRKEKQFMMYGGEVAVGLFALLLLKGKTTIKEYSQHIVMILITGLPILFEGINLLWHFGSYKHFPIRFGYMITFELLIFVGAYLKNLQSNDYKIISRIASLLGIAVLPFIAFILWGFFKQFLYDAIADDSAYASYNIYFLTLSAAFFVIFLIKENRVRNFALFALAIIQAFCGCYGLIAPKVGNADGTRVKYLQQSLEDRAVFNDIESNGYERVKSELLTHEPNYGPIVEQPSIGLWAYGISSDTEALLKEKLRYHGSESSIMDEGGTVFSDALLGVTRILSNHVDDDILYSEIEGKKGLYNSLYKMPFGIVTNKDEINIDTASFEFQNSLFRDVTGVDDELINIVDAKDYIMTENNLYSDRAIEIRDAFVSRIPLSDAVYDLDFESESSYEQDNDNEIVGEEDNTSESDEDATEEIISREYILSIPVTGKKSVYMDAGNFEGEMSMILNGEYLFFSSYLTENANIYPNTIYTGCIPLGSYEGGNVDIKIYSTSESIDGVKIGFLDLDVLSKGIKTVESNQKLNIYCGKNSMHVGGTVNKSGTLFFPVGYSDDWNVSVNGMRAEVKPYINNALIAVEVKEGDVDVDFTFRPKGLTLGIILFIAGVLLIIILHIILKHGGIAGKKYEKAVDCVFIYGYRALAVLILVVMYVIPIYVKIAI